MKWYSQDSPGRPAKAFGAPFSEIEQGGCGSRLLRSAPSPSFFISYGCCEGSHPATEQKATLRASASPAGPGRKLRSGDWPEVPLGPSHMALHPSFPAPHFLQNQESSLTEHGTY